MEIGPNFHDAEVISLSLVRKGESILRVYPYYPHKPATVDFIFENVTDIELQDFSGQNVINDLGIETATDQNGDKVYRLAGRIDAKSLRVKLSPGQSPDGVGEW